MSGCTLGVHIPKVRNMVKVGPKRGRTLSVGAGQLEWFKRKLESIKTRLELWPGTRSIWATIESTMEGYIGLESRYFEL